MTKEMSSFYDFGPFRVDVADRLLWQGKEVVPLTPKAFDLLLVLVESGGRVLSKEDLMRRLWPDSFVEDANLSHNIYKVREALGEKQNGHTYIETLPRRGYRFVATVTEIVSSLADEVGGAADLVVQEHSRARITIEEELIPTPSESEPVQEPMLVTAKGSKIRQKQRSTVMIGIVVVVLGVVTAGYFAWTRNDKQPVNSSRPVQSLAVLPFRQLTPGTDDYIGLGLTDALITRLSGLQQIIVRPTSSVLKFNRSDNDVAAIGHELNVTAVLDGSV